VTWIVVVAEPITDIDATREIVGGGGSTTWVSRRPGPLMNGSWP
jgi:hypothetical protein